MKKLSYLIILLLTFSCSGLQEVDKEKIESGCSVKSIKDLTWIDLEIKENPDYCHVVTIYEGQYNGQTAIIPILSGALCCTCGNTVYNCKGEQLFSCDLDKENSIQNKKIIWQRN